MNSNFTDIASGLTDCLTRDGQAGMTAQLKAIAGTVGAPGISFTNDLTSGMYLSNTGEVSLSAGGVRAFLIDALAFRFTTGIAETGVISPSSIGSDQNDYAPTGIDTASTMRLTSSGAVNITGMAGKADGTSPTSGRKIKHINIGSNTISYPANSTSSTAANRFGIPATFSLFTGQACEWLYDGTSSLWRLIGSHQFVSTVPLGGCQFQLSSATVVKLVPFKGNQVAFPSGAIATISSSGITSTFNNASINGTSGQTLSNTTLYYAYLWDSGSGVYVIDWSTTSHATDTTTGIEIKSGDATRVLVGMAYLVGGNFLDSGNNRLVATWFNRRRKNSRAQLSGSNTASSVYPTYSELDSIARCSFLSWADSVTAVFSGIVSISAGTNTAYTAIGIDGTTPFTQLATQMPNNATNNISSAAGGTTPTEGFHYCTTLGAVGTGTGTWANGVPSILNVDLIN